MRNRINRLKRITGYVRLKIEVKIMSEIIFIIENSDEGGYIAKALGYSIYTEGETLDELKENIRDAIKCHFDAKESPHIVRLHMVKDEVMAI